jgi:hypothetical protein
MPLNFLLWNLTQLLKYCSTVDNWGPQNEAKYATESADIFKIFSIRG